MAIIYKFKNNKNEREYYLQDFLSVVEESESKEGKLEKLAQQITSLCNQPQIYDTLFSFKLKGQKYEIEKAYGYIDYAKTGWQTKSYFTFAIFDDQENIVGTTDIKSNDLAACEIGYWVSAEHSGVMTPALNQLIEFAKSMNYSKLVARAKTANIGSQKVLTRNGFVQNGFYPLEEDQVERFRFERELSI